MKKGSLLTTFAIMLVITFLASAERAFALGKMIITSNLDIGSRGSEVVSVQKCLTEQGLFKVSTTGYYGVITARAVMDFQIKNNIVSSGTATSTGFGRVGPKTRAALNTSCATSIITPPVTPKEGSNVIIK